MSLVSHLECALCGRFLEADRLWNLCPQCGKPLLARNDCGPEESEARRVAEARRPAAGATFLGLVAVVVYWRRGVCPRRMARRVPCRTKFPRR
jgi:hypothetical protein